MSAVVDQPIVIQPVVEQAKTHEEAATDAIVGGAGPVVPSKDQENAAPAVEDKTTTTIKETEAKPKSPRSPFGVLNNLFHRKTSHEVKAPKEETPAVAEPVKEETTVAAVEPATVEAVAPTTEETVTPAEATTTEAPATVESGSPKAKKDGFFDKLKKNFAAEKKASKKSKDSDDEGKTEVPVADDNAVSESSAPVVPALPIAEPIAMPEENVAEVPALVAATEEAPKEAAPAEVASTKAEEPKKEKKKDQAKIGRRLSARLGNIFTSPKKEKTNPLDKSPAVEKTAEEAHPVVAAVEEPKTEDATAAPAADLPVVPATTSDARVVEAAKVEEPKTETAAPTVAVEAPKEDQPKAADASEVPAGSII